MDSTDCLLNVPTTDARYQVQLFGYYLPYLPDFMGDHTLLGKLDAEKLAEILGRFERFAIGLRKYKGVAYSLRFTSYPEQGAIRIYLLGRLMASTSQAQAAAAWSVRASGVHATVLTAN